MIRVMLFSIFIFIIKITFPNTGIVVNTNDSGVGSLRDIISTSLDGDTIRFDNNLIASGSDSIVLSFNIVTSKELVIKGLYNNQDTLYISGNNSTGIFNISNANKFILDSLVLINGRANYGGAISFIESDTLIISNSIFYNNNSNYSGGAIYYKASSSIEYVNKFFLLSIENSIVSKCSAGANGGGIFVKIFSTEERSERTTDLRINMSSIINNTANENGGGLYAETFTNESKSDTKNDIKISNSIIKNNISNLDGGGLCFKSVAPNSWPSRTEAHAYVLIDSCLISKNKSNLGSGGGVFSFSTSSKSISIINILNTIIKANESAEYGGGVISDADNQSISKIYLNNSIVDSNVSLINGGGLMSVAVDAEVIIKKSEVKNNICNQHGGGTYVGSHRNSTIVIDSSSLDNNYAKDGGGGVFLFSTLNSASTNDTANCSINTFKSTFSNNKTLGLGGGVYTYISRSFNSISKPSKSNMSIVKSTFSNNEADSIGGALYSYYRNPSYGNSILNLTIDNSTLVYNKGGGVKYVPHYNFNKGEVNSYISNSIIALNRGGNITNDSITPLTSLGYNIFSDSLIFGLDSTDLFNIDSTSLNLGPLQDNGGSTFTRLPLSFSVALDSGNPTDNSDAQNRPVFGRRDIGAAEYCSTLPGIDTIVSCDSLVWINGITYYNSENIASHNLVKGSVDGCDSLVYLDLIINESPISYDTMDTCNSYTWIDGVTYHFSEDIIYRFIGGAQNGCDSIVFLNLNINRTPSIDNYSVCDSLLWKDGNFYSSSNDSAIFIIQGGSQNGCDSIIILDLTILPISSGVDTLKECSPFIWIDGNTYTSDNDSAIYVLQGASQYGCDSIINLNLTILPNSTGVDTQLRCQSYTWIDGNTYFSTNNTATYTLQAGSQNGCDSIVTLDLTIIPNSNGVDVRTECSPFTWVNGSVFTESNDSAFYTLHNASQNGCDSVITLDLTILPNSNGVDVRTECSPFTWLDGNIYTSSNNLATYSIFGGAENGCDSVVQLDLVFYNLDTSLIFNSSVITSNAVGNGLEYQWFNCQSGLIIPNETSNSLEILENGEYSLEITQNGCSVMTECFSVYDTRLNYNYDIESLKVFPNPTNGLVNVTFENYLGSKIELYSIEGKLLSEITSLANNVQIELPTSNGVYILKVSSLDVVKEFKLIKR